MPGPSEAQLRNRLKVLIAKKEMYFLRIQKLYDYGQRLDDQTCLKNFVMKLKTFESTKLDYLETLEAISDIELQLNPEANINFQAAEAFDDLVCNILTISENPQVKEAMGIRPAETVICNKNVVEPRLPKITLPTFSGNIKEWPIFYECFKSLIHDNTKLSNIDKVSYLVGQLSGKAKNICGGLAPVGSNYAIIWDALIDKYQNSRTLANSYLEQILEFKPAQTASAASLNIILEKCDSAYKALQRLQIDDLLDFTYAYLLWSKLDPETRNFFENNRRKKTIHSYEEIVEFIKEQAQIYAMSPGCSKQRTQSFFARDGKSYQCVVCQSAEHDASHCSKFLSKSPFDRYKLIKENNLCILCFGTHKVALCDSSLSCKVCNFKHNSLLHFVKSKPVTDNRSSGSPDNSKHTSTASYCATVDTVWNTKSTVLLSTVMVNICDRKGTPHKIRFLLDSGSQANFLSMRSAKLLQLKIRPCDWSVRGIGVRGSSIEGETTTIISSCLDENIRYSIDVLLVEKITDKLPDYRIPSEYLAHLSHLPLADDTFSEPGPVDGILGAQLFSLVLGSRKVTGSVHAPIGIETKLGYVIMGSVPIVANHSKLSQSFHTTVEPSLDKLLVKFWELEDVPQQKFKDPEDLECENIYTSTVKREESGRYVVSLPFKFSASKLGDSYLSAKKRFHLLENKFEKFPQFKEQYCAVIREHLREGYISRVESSELHNTPNYFIPHHAVLKQDSVSTPIRCVFDASCKTTAQLSLNDLLYTGEKLQLDVFDLFLNFRLFPIAFTADISRMYLRISMHPDHRRFQQILWRFSKEENLEIYSLNTVSFGVKSSPFLALRTLRQLATDEAKNYPQAAQVVKRDFFMDDYISSVSSLDEAKLLYRQLVDLLESGNFKLTKWAVNSKELLDEIPNTERSPKIVNFDNDGLKVLGLQWYPNSDNFTFNIRIELRDCTKRNMLSTIARLFDPLGFLAPIVLLIKLLIKKLWILKLEWDEVPTWDISNQWRQVQAELPLLDKFKIPRHLGVFGNSKVVLIGFCDACLESYGALVYLKSTTPDNEVFVDLVCAKTKVAPMKVQSIPRLELCAASLLAKLLHLVKTTLGSRVAIDGEYALSDSAVALNWIAAPPYKWQTFVANRVSRIQTLVVSQNWFHIEGQNNISDSLSRGMKPSQFMAMKYWASGPDWLKQDVSEWPIKPISMLNASNLPEQRVVSFLITKYNHPLYDLISRCSSWNKLVRSTVYVLRFLKILSSSGAITASDLEKAELTLVKIVQQHHFSSEFLLLEKRKLVSPHLRALSPFVQDDLIRVGGRLGNANLELDRQHPLLLPRNDHFVDLLIDQCHRQNLHTGPSLVLSILRQRYWIIGARNKVRFRLGKCNHCFRLNPKETFPKMADLPAVRVTEAKPFLHVGVDMAGPFFITMTRNRGIRSQKAYLCLFVCLTTKALHLELVSSLSTDMFLAAFKRFLSRRGACSVIYSDCGTNFVGAKNEINELYRLLNSDEYKNAFEVELAHRKIVWKFQPPLSPHFSGVWESQIKAVKTHLYKVIGSQILSYEEFNTVLVQIEAILNSRPLSWLSTDPSDPSPLTPAHFLTLTPLTSLPAPELPDPPKDLLNRKRLLDHLVQQFWIRWKNDYLTQLQVRQKWHVLSSPIEVGMLVLIKQDNVPPLHWPVGIVDAVFPSSKDNIVRVVNVKTKTGIYKRPVVRLCPLPTQ